MLGYAFTASRTGWHVRRVDRSSLHAQLVSVENVIRVNRCRCSIHHLVVNEVSKSSVHDDYQESAHAQGMLQHEVLVLSRCTIGDEHIQICIKKLACGLCNLVWVESARLIFLALLRVRLRCSPATCSARHMNHVNDHYVHNGLRPPASCFFCTVNVPFSVCLCSWSADFEMPRSRQ
jgi:hypothetical protein